MQQHQLLSAAGLQLRSESIQNGMASVLQEKRHQELHISVPTGINWKTSGKNTKPAKQDTKISTSRRSWLTHNTMYGITEKHRSQYVAELI